MQRKPLAAYFYSSFPRSLSFSFLPSTSSFKLALTSSAFQLTTGSLWHFGRWWDSRTRATKSCYMPTLQSNNSGSCLMETSSLHLWERLNFLSFFKRSKAVTKCTVTGLCKSSVSVKKKKKIWSHCYAFQKKLVKYLCRENLWLLHFICSISW